MASDVNVHAWLTFKKTEIEMVILRCLMGLNLNWFRNGHKTTICHYVSFRNSLYGDWKGIFGIPCLLCNVASKAFAGSAVKLCDKRLCNQFCPLL